MKRAALFFAFPLLAVALLAHENAESGEEAIAARYLTYALTAADSGRWQDAETTLVRAVDYSGISSELSFYLALARRKLDRPLGSVLEAVQRALETSRWTSRNPDDARLLKAECLLDLRSFDEALSVLSMCAESADSTYFSLRALHGADNGRRFLRRMEEALALYPRDTRFVRLLFDSVAKRAGNIEEQKLVALAVDRLPFLLDADPFLAVSAAPFVRNLEDRRRLVAAYRASSAVKVESVPVALELGLIQERDAVEELFAQKTLGRRLLLDTYSELRTQEVRLLFARKCAAFSGTVTEDRDGDGRPESSTRYESGDISSFFFDADQDGINEWELRFADGLPVGGVIACAAEFAASDPAVPRRSVDVSEPLRAEITWERYPYVASAAVGDHLFRFPPRGFPFAPVRLLPIFAASSTRIPNTDPVTPRLTERSMFSFASSLSRPGNLAPGSMEQIDYSGGTPVHSLETVGNRIIAITNFVGGYPVSRRSDHDLDGRFETIERYKKNTFEIVSVETDFDGDGVFEKDISK